MRKLAKFLFLLSALSLEFCIVALIEDVLRPSELQLFMMTVPFSAVILWALGKFDKPRKSNKRR